MEIESDKLLCDRVITHGSLFSGIGGFDLAAQWVGWNNVFQCEKDEWCRKVLAKNFPATKRLEDIKEFNAKEYNGTIDVISGGFPCQPFSVAGQRKGKEDDRYLWEEMLRVVNEIKPPFVVGENVTGIIGMALDTVLSDLEAQGYTTETYIIPACSKNAWHRRDRVWIIAYTSEHDGWVLQGQQANERGKQTEVNGISNSGIFLSNTTSERQQGQRECSKRSSNKKETERQTDNAFANGINDQWTVEPGVGRKIDGFSSWLDRNINFVFNSHYCMFADGKLNNYTNGTISKKRATEILSNLRSRIKEGEIQWEIAGLHSIQQQEILQSYLCKYEESVDKAWLLMEGKEAHQDILRSLRIYEVFTGASHRPGQEQQRTGKYSNSLQTLPRFLALNAEKAWEGYCRQNDELIPDQWDSLGFWELGTNRVANGIPNRVDRLKGLGNAIVPQVAFEIFTAIDFILKKQPFCKPPFKMGKQF